jgi:hypothetical protein
MVQEATMPQPRKYETRSQQQAAYRKRQALSQQELLSQKGLPPLPAIPTIPGTARWSAMIAQAQTLLSTAAQEMQTYHEARSESWQESTRADDLLAKLERLQESVSQLDDLD